MVDDGVIVPIAEEIAHENLVDLEAIERQPALFERLAQGVLRATRSGHRAGHLREVQQEAPRPGGWSNRRHGVVRRLGYLHHVL
ncbi:MAG: hypothetical protein ACREWE_10655 [Gammaproteobacteria bacterium]